MAASTAQQIAENYQNVISRAAEAAVRSGREPSDVTVVAVTKYVETDLIQPLIDAGCVELAESRPQQLWSKAEALAGEHVRWHLVGHLQRNKVARTLRYTSLIHSVDSERLLQAIDQAESESPVDVLLEVNVSGDEAKHGFQPDEMQAVVAGADKFANVRIRGLMAMAALRGGAERARRDFIVLRELRDALSGDCPAEVTLTELSMGMSADFEEAIEEGATLVRVGRVLFEGVSL